MTPRSRWERTSGASHVFSEQQLDYLTSIDGKNHAACCAIVEENGERAGIGLARYMRLQDQATVAEFALTVIDEYQSKGIGTSLFAALLETARHNQLDILRGYIRPGNHRVLRICRHFPHVIRFVDGAIEMDVLIPGERLASCGDLQQPRQHGRQPQKTEKTDDVGDGGQDD